MIFVEKTLADALDKALDLAKQGIVAGFEMVKQAAPYVWSLAQRQTIIEGVECAFFAVICAIIMCYFPRMWRWAKRECDATAGMSYFGAVVATFVTSVTFIVLFLNAVNYIANPGYWTIMKIAEMLHPSAH